MADQETPEQRIARIDASLIDFEQGHRDLAARHWRWGRRMLQLLPGDLRENLTLRWNESSVPPDAAYFADFVRIRLRRCGILDGKFNRHDGTHPGLLPETAFHDADRLHRVIRGSYYDGQGRRIGSSRMIPADYPTLALGSWRIDQSTSGSYGRFIDQLIEVDPGELLAHEGDYTDPGNNFEGRGDDARRYAAWLERGLPSPPIEVNELETGRLCVMDGHRRVAAAKMVRQTIRAWVSWAVDSGQTDSRDEPIKTALTYELAREMLRRCIELGPPSKQTISTSARARNVSSTVVQCEP